jgi:hypothetical protein
MILRTGIKHKPLVEKFVRFLCEELAVFPTSITIVPFDEKDCVGICIDESDTEFLILVKEDGRNIGEVFTTIAHEMIHVKQYMKQNLGWLLDQHNHIPYEQRWWENEAFTNAIPLVEKFAKKL